MNNLALNNIDQNFHYKLKTNKNYVFENKNNQIKLSKIGQKNFSRNFNNNNNNLTKFKTYKKLSKKINNNSSLSIFSPTNFSSNFSQENNNFQSFNLNENKFLNKIKSQPSIFNNNSKFNELNKKSKNLFLNGISKKILLKLNKNNNNNFNHKNKNFFPILNKKNYIKNSIPKEINFNDLNQFSINYLHKTYNLFILKEKLKITKIQSNLNRQILIDFNKFFSLSDPNKFSEKFRFQNKYFN